MGPIEAEERRQRITRSHIGNRYDRMLDRESAYELLKARAEREARQEEEQSRTAAEHKSVATS